MTCVDRHGVAKTTLSDVAAVAGITRKTLYRYFPNMEALLYETGAVAAAEFVQRLVVHASKWIEPADVLAEAVCFAIEQLPKEPYAGLLIAGGRPDLFALGTTSRQARDNGRLVLDLLFEDPAVAFPPGTRLDDVVEICLRTIASFVLDPGAPRRTKAERRRIVRVWLLPAVGLADPVRSG